MNLQIIGTKKCRDTRKAERFFSDRGIPFHFRNLSEKGLAKGELDNIKLTLPVEDLIDKEGVQFKKRNMSYLIYDVEEELLKDPLLIKTPVVRNGKSVTIGYVPEIWKSWISNNK